MSKRMKPGQTLFFCLILAIFSQSTAKAVFTFLEHNPKWYRTWDSTSFIIQEKGELLFSWWLEDKEKAPDSFFVGVDTLWAAPQNLFGDTANDWDLQVCPDEICIQGLKRGASCDCGSSDIQTGCPAGFCTNGEKPSRGFGGNAAQVFGNFIFDGEHHFQFYPGFDTLTFRTHPRQGSVFGSLMFARSLSTGEADTVFGFGAWEMVWDTNYAPPVRPVDGYIPKVSDFEISGDTVRYIKNRQDAIESQKSQRPQRGFLVQPSPFVLKTEVVFQKGEKGGEVFVYDLSGRKIWRSGTLSKNVRSVSWQGKTLLGRFAVPGLYVLVHKNSQFSRRVKVIKL